MAAPFNAEWLNQNSRRAYPFRENTRRRPTIDGTLVEAYALPEGCILDMVVATNFDPPPEVYLSAFTLSGKVATAVIARTGSDGQEDVLAAASVVQGSEDFTPVNFVGSGIHDDIRGTIVFGDLTSVGESIPDGVYRFTKEETLFEARCSRPSAPCVSGLYIGNINASRAPRLRGDVALIAGDNIRLEYDENENAIVINADSNYAYNESCACEDDPRSQILSINGMSVSAFELVSGNECISITTSDGKVKIEDKCSTPCCGCAELAFLNQKTNEITTAITKLDAFSSVLASKMESLNVNSLITKQGRLAYG